MQNNQRMQAGADFNPNWEWVGRTSYIYPLVNIVVWGMGIPLGAAACLAFLWALWRIIKKRESLNLVLVGWVGIYFLWWGKGSTPRCATSCRSIRRSSCWRPGVCRSSGNSRKARSSTLSLPARPRDCAIRPCCCYAARVVAVVGLTALWALAFTNIYRQPLSRVQASAWMIDNLPKDAVITCEAWDDCVPFGLPGKPAAPRTIHDRLRTAQDLSDPTSIHNVDCASWDKTRR